MLLVGDKILEYRKAANLTQEEFAAKVGVTRQAVSKWELDKAYPDLDKLVDICEIFQVSITEFIYGRPDAEQETGGTEEKTEFAGRIRGKGAFVRLYSMLVLLGGILVFWGVVCGAVFLRYSWSKNEDFSEQARVERVYQQYTRADVGIYDKVGRRVVKTIWLDVDGIREGDYIECYTNQEQDGIFYEYHVRTLAVCFCLALLALLLFLLCLGEILRLGRENRWRITPEQEETLKRKENEEREPI